MRATRWARHALLTLVSPMVAALVPSHLTLSPNDWLDLGAAPASRNITLIFALQHTPAQRSIVDTHFRAAVEPGTPAYGQFVSTRDIRAFVEPDAATLMAVRSVLPANAPLRSLGDGDFLETELTHMAASQLLSVPRFHVYEHVYHRVRYTRPAKPPQLPSALAPHVAFVGGATHLPSLPVRPTRGRTRTAAGSQPSFRPKAKVSTFVPTRAPIRNVTAARRRLIPSAVPAVPPVPGKRRYIPFANPIPWRGENITILAGLRCQDASFPSATHDCVDEYAMRTLHIILSTHTSYAQRELKLPDTDIYYSIDGSQFWADVKTNKMVRQVKIDPYCMPCSHWQGAPFVDGVDVHALCVDLIRQQTSAASPPDQLMCLLRFARPDLVGYKVRITGEMYYQYTEPYPNSVSMHCIKDGRHKVNAAECSDIFTPQPLVSASSLRAALSLPSVQRGYSPLNAQALVQVDNGGKSEGSGDTARSILDAARADVAAFDRVNRLPEAKMILSAVDAPLPKAKHLSSGAKLSKSNLPRSAESIEAAAGLEVMSLLSPSVEAWYWHIRGGAAKTSQTAPQQHLEEEPLLQWLLALSTQHAGSATTTSNGGVSKRLPWVQVLLYTEPESLLSREFTDRINTEFQKAALRGFTIVVSSGADGAPGSLLKRGDGTCSRFEPEFPATSPYVTSVGTTAEQRVASSLGRRLRGDSKGPTQAQVIAEFKRIQQESEKGEIQQVPGTNPSHSQNDGSVRNRSAGHNAKAKSKKAAVAIQSSNKFEQELEQKALANAALNGGAGVGVGAAVPAASAVAAAAAAAAIPASTWRLQTVVSDASLGVGISSGGGFSTRYRRAAYQQREVSQYLSAHPTLPAAMFNESGRAFPDIAMPGLSSGLPAFAIRGRTGALLQGDTAAAAAPAAFGALISQLNDVRLQRGQPPLGFLNPLLYRLSRHVFGAHHLRAFVDVTEGENRCSSEPSRCCVGGFPAARGWDAATGLGIPNFTAITLILTDDACFGIECGGGVCSQGRCVCYNGHGYDAGGRCVPLKPFPKKLIMQVAALSLAGTFFLVQLLRCLYGCCCAKREGTSGKHDKRGCLSRCFTCLCMCCPFELALEPADDEMANRAEMMPIGSSASARAQGTEYLSGSGASGYSSVDPSSTGINEMSAPTALDDFESVNVSQSSQKPAMGTSDVSASGFGSNAGSSAPASNCAVCNVCFLALPQHEVWCPYYKGEDAQNTL